MKTQISRNSHQSQLHYSGVYQQQGRMITDADWNEMVDIVKLGLNNAMSDIIGSGTSKTYGLKIIKKANKLHIKPGSIAAKGVIGEILSPAGNLTEFKIEEQGDFPECSQFPNKNIKIYADVWDRTVSSLEDNALQDAALHGADTCSRTQRMVQIKCCDKNINPEDQAENPSHGDATLALKLRNVQVGNDPYDPCSSNVNLKESVGNYLFRAEIHDVVGNPDNPDTITLKWSRENAAEYYQILDDDNNEIPVPVDFETGDWVFEHYNDVTEKHLGVHLASSSSFKAQRGVFKQSVEIDSASPYKYVRRWDGCCTLKRNGSTWNLHNVPGHPAVDKYTSLKALNSNSHGSVHIVAGGARISLEKIELNLEISSKQFVAGDYWEAVVRETENLPGADILGKGGNGVLPLGVQHNYLLLAELQANGTFKPLTDKEKRQLNFPALSAIAASDVGFDNNAANLYANAKNIQEALNNLVNIDAGDISLDKSDADLNGVLNSPAVNTVQDALKVLSKNIGGTDYPVTIGEQGQFATIKQALNANQNAKSLWFCLLPGVHAIPQNPKINDVETVRITASSSSSAAIKLGGLKTDIKAIEIILENISVQFENQQGQLFLEANHVSVEGCNIFRKSSTHSAGPLVMVGSNDISTNLHWQNNRITSTWNEYIVSDLEAVFVAGISVAGRNVSPVAEDVKKLLKLDPVYDASAYNKELANVAKKIAEMPAATRKKWATYTPAASLNALPETANDVMLRAERSTPLRINDLEGAAIATYAMRRSPNTPQRSIKTFVAALKGASVTSASIGKVLDAAIVSSVKKVFGPCIGLASHEVGGCIKDSKIYGEILLNAAIPSPLDLRYRISKIFTASQALKTLVDEGANIDICNNEICKISALVGKTQVNAAGIIKNRIDSHNTLTINGNVFHHEDSVLLARFLTMAGNTFDTADKPTDVIVFPIASYGVFTGNMAVSPYASINKKLILGFKEAANYVKFV